MDNRYAKIKQNVDKNSKLT